jgi:hypothetical protein
MQAKPDPLKMPTAVSDMIDLYKDVRSRTIRIVVPLEIEDYVIQTAPFMVL